MAVRRHGVSVFTSIDDPDTKTGLSSKESI